MIQTKILQGTTPKELENKINELLKKHLIENIRFSVANIADRDYLIYTALVIYDDTSLDY